MSSSDGKGHLKGHDISFRFFSAAPKWPKQMCVCSVMSSMYVRLQFNPVGKQTLAVTMKMTLWWAIKRCNYTEWLLYCKKKTVHKYYQRDWGLLKGLKVLAYALDMHYFILSLSRHKVEHLNCGKISRKFMRAVVNNESKGTYRTEESLVFWLRLSEWDAWPGVYFLCRHINKNHKSAT